MDAETFSAACSVRSGVSFRGVNTVSAIGVVMLEIVGAGEYESKRDALPVPLSITPKPPLAADSKIH